MVKKSFKDVEVLFIKIEKADKDELKREAHRNEMTLSEFIRFKLTGRKC